MRGARLALAEVRVCRDRSVSQRADHMVALRVAGRLVKAVAIEGGYGDFCENLLI